MDQTGFHNWHHTQSPKVLFIDSQDATQSNPTGDSEFTYNFNDGFHIKKGEGVLVSLLQASIPYSFYNIRIGVNDTLKVRLLQSNLYNYSFTTLTIPQGNYTATTLRRKVKELLETQLSAIGSHSIVSIDYDRDRQKFKFSIRATDVNGVIATAQRIVIFDLDTQNTSMFNIMLGFPLGTHHYFSVNSNIRSAGTAQVSGGGNYVTDVALTPTTTEGSDDNNGVLVAPHVADLNGGIHSLYVRSNLPVISSMDSATGGVSQILAKVPIMSGPGSIIFHEPQNSVHKSLIQTQIIRNITIRLTDDRNRVVSLNGLYFNVALMFEFVSLETMPERQLTFQSNEVQEKKGKVKETPPKKKRSTKMNPEFLSMLNTNAKTSSEHFDRGARSAPNAITSNRDGAGRRRKKK